MPRPKSTDRLTSKLEAAKALELEIKTLKLRERAAQKLATEARFRVAGREVMAYVESNPDSKLAKAVMDWLAKRLTKPGERRLFPELGAQPENHPPESARQPEADAQPASDEHH